MTLVSPRPPLADAYAECARITREQARNFHYGIRLLPPPKRAALSAVYAFARRADDIGDDLAVPADERLARLGALRAELAGLDGAQDPVLTALADVAHRYPLPVDALGELLDGIEMDIRGVRYETFEDLVTYCRRVAGTVGRLSLSIFGTSAPDGPRLADRLGVALQQTNILRDIREDLAAGRIYLPAAELRAHGVDLALDPAGRIAGRPEPLLGLVRSAAARAESWYAEGLALLAGLDRRSFACCAAMAGIYHRLNRRIRREPAAVLDRRVSLTPAAKAAVAARSLLGMRS